jgi:hypothetical protein
VRYDPLPWTDRPTFIAVYTLKDGTERAYAEMRVSQRGGWPLVRTSVCRAQGEPASRPGH